MPASPRLGVKYGLLYRLADTALVSSWDSRLGSPPIDHVPFFRMAVRKTGISHINSRWPGALALFDFVGQVGAVSLCSSSQAASQNLSVAFSLLTGVMVKGIDIRG